MPLEAADRHRDKERAPAFGTGRSGWSRPKIGSLRLAWPPQTTDKASPLPRYAALALVLAAGLLLVTAASGIRQRWLYPLAHQELIVHFARENNLSPSLVAAVVRQESHFRANARSSMGALGLMQLLPSTARWVSEELARVPYAPETLLLPEVNLRLGATYLGHLRDRFRDEPVLYLSAYNAGPQVVEEWLRRQEGQLTIPEIPFPETRAYVASVLRLQARYGELYPDLDDERGGGAESESETK
jgi:soluble lytic murein transglycosylase